MDDSILVTKHQPEPILVSKREAASLLSVCPRTIDNLVARRELPVRRIGRRVLIPRRALEQFARRDHLNVQRDGRVPIPSSPEIQERTASADGKALSIEGSHDGCS